MAAVRLSGHLAHGLGEREADVLLRPARVCEPRQKQLHRHPAGLLKGLADSRQPSVVGAFDIVEPEHRRVAGCVQAGLARRPQDPECPKPQRRWPRRIRSSAAMRRRAVVSADAAEGRPRELDGLRQGVGRAAQPLHE